jgi:hypothetical protein
MRTSLIPALFLLVIASLCSCQREIDIDPGSNPPTSDSAWYISSIHRLDYDTLGNIIDSSAEHYSYLTNKAVYKYISNEFGVLDSFQYTFDYDQNKRLTKFNLDYSTAPLDDDAKTILFTYTGSNAAQADITYWNGNTLRNYITYSNGNKTITLYDTLPPFEKPVITYFYLGTDNRIDSIKEMWKTGDAPYYLDASYTRLNYDAQNNVTKSYCDLYIEHTISTGSFTIDGFDSVIVQSRETRGAEVGNTWNKILSNMSWYPELSSNSLYNIREILIYSKYPMIFAKRWSRVYTIQTILVTPKLYVGNFVNTFDANNLLIKQEVPPGFANKYGGGASLKFTYIKLPQ